MIPTPTRKAPINRNGLNDMAQANNVLAKSIHAGIAGVGQFIESQYEVQRIGEESKLYDGLDVIAQECNEELSAQAQISDWAAAWSKAYAPRAEALLQEFPERNRASHLALAQRHSQRASANAQSEFEKGRLQEAKGHWMGRMKTASEQCLVEEQDELFNKASGVFYPEAEREESQQHFRSANKKNEWMQGFQRDPLATLLRVQQAGEDDLPTENKHREELATHYNKVQTGLKAQLTQSLMTSIINDMPFDEEALRNSAKAQIVKEEDVDACLKADAKSSPLDLCLWTRRIDECDYSDTNKTIDVHLAMLSSPLSREEKSKLLSRAEHAKLVPHDQRCRINQQAWALYSNGYLGAQGDAYTLARLNKIQSSGLTALREDPKGGHEAWTKQIEQNLDTWVCYNDNN